jgi:uncharacterized protein (DUF2235 family)
MPKTLVVCCDGTWQTPDQDAGPTNVTKMARAIQPRNERGDHQLVFYDEGVGTGNRLDRLIGGAIGRGLSENVQQAYRFLALNYEDGDAICVFGFSRGAYTVRSVAGLVALAGLLHKGDLEYMPQVWEHYRTFPDDRKAGTLPARERARYPMIDLVGVWDTVGSLGIPGNVLGRIGRRKHQFHDVMLSSKIRHAYQALAIDERRGNFQPAIWDTTMTTPEQKVEQVWFAGGHGNIGGGISKVSGRDDHTALSDMAFLWMIEKVRPLLAVDEGYVRTKVRQMNQDTLCGFIADQAKSGIWRVLPKYVRKLGGDPSEAVHPSTEWRLNHSGEYKKTQSPFIPFPYRPVNLIDWLIGQGKWPRLP